MLAIAAPRFHKGLPPSGGGRGTRVADVPGTLIGRRRPAQAPGFGRVSRRKDHRTTRFGGAAPTKAEASRVAKRPETSSKSGADDRQLRMSVTASPG